MSCFDNAVLVKAQNPLVRVQKSITKTWLGIVLIHHTKTKYLGQYSTAIILHQLYINGLFLTQFYMYGMLLLLPKIQYGLFSLSL